MSRPTISKAQTSYPIYAASWATSRPSQLIVGGGGGAGKHGVKNQLSLFDFSSRAPQVEPVAEHEVSKDDSVTCLANLASEKDSLIVYAGNSSSEAEKLKGGDMHFKAFEVKLVSEVMLEVIMRCRLTWSLFCSLRVDPQALARRREAAYRH